MAKSKKTIKSPSKIKRLEIKNFKSLKNIKIDVSRVNIFIGRPNSGKSNLLEAITLFDGIQTRQDRSGQPHTIRYNTLDNLFYDRNLNEDIEIKLDKNFVLFSYYNPSNFFFHVVNPSLEFLKNKASLYNRNVSFDEISREVTILSKQSNLEKFSSTMTGFNFDGLSIFGGKTSSTEKTGAVKRYVFQERSNYGDLYAASLKPFGENLFAIVQGTPQVREWISSFYDEYELEFLMDFTNRQFEIQKREKGIVYKIPFELTPDTFRRMLFHIAAVHSNRNSTILFEEPESHSFPPYIKELSELIKRDKGNDYFITTHSPYFFNSLVEDSESIRDISFFHVYYEDYQTKIKKLSQKDLDIIWGSGTDVFFNIDSLQK